MSQFLRSAPKMGMATFYTIAPANNSRVVVPDADALILQKMVVARINAVPDAGTVRATPVPARTPL